jgi:1-acyl-sn-glycerol-3-phosphate acyltransferase
VAASQFYRLLPALWSRSFPFWRLRIEGAWPAQRGPYVIVANHQSFLDIFVLCNIFREWKWVAKRELFKLPFFGWGFSLTGSISLDRGDVASAMKVMEKARRCIEDGLSVMLFPEGTRSKDGQLLPFRPGAFKLAIETGVPVLPIAISGTAQGMPKGNPWVRPTRITIRILDPVPTAGLTNRNVRKLRDEVRDRLAHALGQGAPSASAERPRANGAAGRVMDGEEQEVPVRSGASSLPEGPEESAARLARGQPTRPQGL